MFTQYIKKINKSIEGHKLLSKEEEREISRFFKDAEAASFGAKTIRGTTSDLIQLEEALESYRGLKLMLELING